MDAGAWWAAVHGVAKSQTRLNDSTFSLHLATLLVQSINSFIFDTLGIFHVHMNTDTDSVCAVLNCSVVSDSLQCHGL